MAIFDAFAVAGKSGKRTRATAVLLVLLLVLLPVALWLSSFPGVRESLPVPRMPPTHSVGLAGCGRCWRMRRRKCMCMCMCCAACAVLYPVPLAGQARQGYSSRQFEWSNAATRLLARATRLLPRTTSVRFYLTHGAYCYHRPSHQRSRRPARPRSCLLYCIPVSIGPISIYYLSHLHRSSGSCHCAPRSRHPPVPSGCECDNNLQALAALQHPRSPIAHHGLRCSAGCHL